MLANLPVFMSHFTANKRTETKCGIERKNSHSEDVLFNKNINCDVTVLDGVGLAGKRSGRGIGIG